MIKSQIFIAIVKLNSYTTTTYLFAFATFVIHTYTENNWGFLVFHAHFAFDVLISFM